MRTPETSVVGPGGVPPGSLMSIRVHSHALVSWADMMSKLRQQGFPDQEILQRFNLLAQSHGLGRVPNGGQSLGHNRWGKSAFVVRVLGCLIEYYIDGDFIWIDGVDASG